MANQTVADGPSAKPVLTLSLLSSADMSAKQYRFVKMSANKTVVVCSGATDKPIGILQNDPTAGQMALVMVLGVSKLSADVTLAFGDVITTSADGQGAKTASASYNCGQTILGAAAGELAEVAVNCINPGIIA